MVRMTDEGEVCRNFEVLSAVMRRADETSLGKGVEAEFGAGGIAALERATGMSRTTNRMGRGRHG